MTKWSEITLRTTQGATVTCLGEWLDSYLTALGSDVRMFLPFFEQDPGTSGVKVTDIGPKCHHFSNETAFDNDPYIRGRVLAYILNGTDEALSMVDHNDFTFGSGTADSAFSVGAWVNFKATASGTILSRRDDTTGSTNKEWSLFTDSNGKLFFELYDDSVAGAKIGRSYNTALSADTWYFIVATYDATEASTGINIYLDGDAVDDTDSNNGSYVAMENKAVVTAVGYYEDTGGSKADYLNGHMWGPFITAEELSAASVTKLEGLGELLLGF